MSSKTEHRLQRVFIFALIVFLLGCCAAGCTTFHRGAVPYLLNGCDEEYLPEEPDHDCIILEEYNF